MSDWNVIYGPPGTGKTTRGVKFVFEMVEKGIPLHKIAYLAFTRKAAGEIKSRVVERFGKDDGIIFFRTIHSFCFGQLGLNKNKIMQRGDWVNVGKLSGLDTTGYSVDEEDSFSNNKKPGDIAFFLYNLSRITGKSLFKTYNDSLVDSIEFSTIEEAVSNLIKYKERNGLMDFNDILLKYIESGTVPDIQALFVDEAQDLSYAQWKVIEKISAGVEYKYAAGDDDQAIFKWAGAYPEYFNGLEGNKEVLSQSYRLPDAVHGFASRIISKVKSRQPKLFKPTDREGKVLFISDIDDIADHMTKDTWLLLTRNYYMLSHLETLLKEYGFLFHKQSKGVVDRYGDIAVAIRNFMYLLEGKTMLGDSLNRITPYSSFYNKYLPDQSYDLASSDFPNDKWQKVFDKLSHEDIAYFTRCEVNGEFLEHRAGRIKLSTIHGAKGGEANNVVLLDALSPRVWESYELNPDDEHRLFYVGATRAKDNLYILESSSRYKYEM